MELVQRVFPQLTTHGHTKTYLDKAVKKESGTSATDPDKAWTKPSPKKRQGASQRGQAGHKDLDKARVHSAAAASAQGWPKDSRTTLRGQDEDTGLTSVGRGQQEDTKRTREEHRSATARGQQWPCEE